VRTQGRSQDLDIEGVESWGVHKKNMPTSLNFDVGLKVIDFDVGLKNYNKSSLISSSFFVC
jgi:hypothetical protein